MFISNLLGLGAHFGREGQNCLFCQVYSNKIFHKTPSKPRTLERLYRMAHMLGPGVSLPFDCPGCKRHFATQDDLASELEPLDTSAYEKAHASSGWHRPPLVNIEPQQYILCCLHLLLSLTKLLFKKRILPMLFTESQALKLNMFLSSIGVCLPRQHKVGDTVDSEQSGRVRFTGPDCVALMSHWDYMVDLCYHGCKTKVGMKEWADDT